MADADQSRKEELAQTAIETASSSPAHADPSAEPPALFPKPVGLNEANVKTSGHRIWTALSVLIVLAWTGLLVFSRQPLSAEAFGYWVGLLLIPFCVAYAIAGAVRRRNWRKFSAWFLSLGIILPALSNQKSLLNLPRADMVRELVGTKVLEPNLPQNEIEIASASRAIFNDIRSFRSSQDEQRNALQPELENLYSSASFSSEGAMQRSPDAVSKRLQLDKDALSFLEKLPDQVSARLNQTKMSEKEKREFMDGGIKGMSDTGYVSAYRKMVLVESDWEQSVADLYQFALAHKSQITVSKETITIKNGTVRANFNSRYSRSTEFRDRFVAEAKTVDALQAEIMKRSGVTPADLGLDKQ